MATPGKRHEADELLAAVYGGSPKALPPQTYSTPKRCLLPWRERGYCLPYTELCITDDSKVVVHWHTDPTLEREDIEAIDPLFRFRMLPTPALDRQWLA